MLPLKHVAYNDFHDFHELPYKAISYLIMNDEIIWKMLKYLTPDALSKPNLTREEKASLIYMGQENMTDFRVFMDSGQSDVWLREDAILRISTFAGLGKDRTRGIITMSFEIYSYYKINYLNTYCTRIDYMTQRILAVMNGAKIGSLGEMYFDAFRDPTDKAFTTGQIPYKGKQILMSANSG